MQNRINLELMLRDMYESMSELSVVLDSEHEALVSQDVEQLQKAAADKEALSDKVEQLESNRTAMLKAQGLDNDLASMKQLIQQSSGYDENALFKIWNMVAELAQECTAKNKLNGIIIETNRRQTNAALSILQGYHDDSTETYDAEGSKIASKSNSSIARA